MSCDLIYLLDAQALWGVDCGGMTAEGRALVEERVQGIRMDGGWMVDVGLTELDGVSVGNEGKR